MTRIAFAADLHIDAYGSRVDPATGLNARLLDYLSTTRWMAQAARDRAAEALVIAGDFTERKHVNDWLIRHIQDALSDGPRNQALLRGNHDPEIAGESKVSVLGEMGPGWQSFIRPGWHVVGDVVLAMLPFLDRHWLRAQPGFEAVPDAEIYQVLGEQFVTIAAGLYASARQAHPHLATVLVCHQSLSGGRMSDSQQAFLGDLSLVIDSRALQDVGFEAVVAGHLHRHQVVVPGDRPVLYAGSIERVDFGEEHETKGFIVADIGHGRFDWEFVPTPARRYVTLDDATIGEALGVEGAIVRARFTDPDVDLVDVRRLLEERGAFEVTEVSAVRRDAVAIAGGLSETLAPAEALSEYFHGDPDRDALVERGRELLVAA